MKEKVYLAITNNQDGHLFTSYNGEVFYTKFIDHGNLISLIVPKDFILLHHEHLIEIGEL